MRHIGEQHLMELHLMERQIIASVDYCLAKDSKNKEMEKHLITINMYPVIIASIKEASANGNTSEVNRLCDFLTETIHKLSGI